MGRLEQGFTEGDPVGPLVKEITQEAINLFEGSSGESGPCACTDDGFTDEGAARETLGTSGTVASGRMSISFALELLRRHFGSDVFNHSGMVDLRFLRPVRPGDAITFTGEVTGTSREANGLKVNVKIEAQNQRGDTTGVGSGSAIVPQAYLPPEE